MLAPVALEVPGRSPWQFRESHLPFPVVVLLPIRCWRKNTASLSLCLCLILAPLSISHDFLLSHNTCIASFDTQISSLRHSAVFVVISSLSYAFSLYFLFSFADISVPEYSDAYPSYHLASPIPPSISFHHLRDAAGVGLVDEHRWEIWSTTRHDIIRRHMTPDLWSVSLVPRLCQSVHLASFFWCVVLSPHFYPHCIFFTPVIFSFSPLVVLVYFTHSSPSY